MTDLECSGKTTITAEDYKQALRVIQLSDTEFEMLRSQYAAPDYRISAGQLAKQFNVHTVNINNWYDKLGKRVAEALGDLNLERASWKFDTKPSGVSYLSCYIQTSTNVDWIMHSSLAQAITESGIMK